MKNAFIKLRDTFIAGAIFLLPLMIVFVVVSKITQELTGFSTRIAGVFGMKSIVGISAGTIISALIIIILCLLFGYLAKYSFFKGLNSWADKKLQRHLPGYSMYREMAMAKLENRDEKLPYESAAWIELDNLQRPAFVVESLADDQCIVFVPTAGKVNEGNIYLVEKDKVHLLPQIDMKAFQASIGNQGTGLSKFQESSLHLHH